MGLFDFLHQKKSLSHLSSDGEKIYEISKAGIAFLNDTYKRISDKGWFEAMIFHGVILLKYYKHKKPHLYADAEKDFFRMLFGVAKDVGINANFETLKNFINKRIQLFGSSLQQIYNQDESYIPGDLYAAFYETPFKNDLKPSYNVSEIMRFFVVLSQSIKTTHHIADREL